MAKFIRRDFGGIHDALNNLIIAEVKAALELLPEKCIDSGDGSSPLCRIVLSPSFDYEPRDVEVDKVYLDGDGDIAVVDRNDNDEWIIGVDCDCLDITDFAYLIDQIAEKVEGDKTVVLPTLVVKSCDIAPEFLLEVAIQKTT